MSNPFPGYMVKCTPQVKYNSQWGNPTWWGYWNDQYSGGRGIIVNLLDSGTIVVQTGTNALIGEVTFTGNPFNSTSAVTTALPCRIYVEKGGALP
jgi:hypothetical protein